jgi:hypothetical protein
MEESIMMSLLAATRATLHVIGLATMVQGNRGIDVVMPRVNTAVPPIEEHMSILIVRNEEIVPPTSVWTTGPYSEGFTWVDLTGEDVDFLVGASNPVAGVPLQLPHLTSGCKWMVPPEPPRVAVGKTPALRAAPRIHESAAPPPLLPGYRAPLYKAAAAVLRVPYGVATACRASVRDEPRARIDTRVAWSTGGEVTIIGKRHHGRLRLRGTEILIVAGNVPKYFLFPEEELHRHHTDKGHFRAYYTMLSIPGQARCAYQEPAGTIPSCPESTIRAVHVGNDGLPGVTRPVPQIMFLITSECSNSQYP